MRDVQARMLRILSGAEEAAIHLPERCYRRRARPGAVPDDHARSKQGRCVLHRKGRTHSTYGDFGSQYGYPGSRRARGCSVCSDQARNPLAIEGSAGAVIIEPDAETVAAYRARQAEQVEARHAAYAAARAAAKTQDGHRVEVVANLAAAAEVQLALDAGAEGVGCCAPSSCSRTAPSCPTEDEQYEAYRQVAEAMSPRPRHHPHTGYRRRQALALLAAAGGDESVPGLAQRSG